MSFRLSDYAIAVRTAARDERMPAPAMVRVGIAERAVPEGLAVEAGVTADELYARITDSGAVPGGISIDGQGHLAVAHAPAGGRMAGVVAMVTGAAQGFGLGIAEELVKEGAWVAVADMNAELGAAAADGINKAAGRDAAVFCQVNVTDSASVKACVDGVLGAFGGIDLLVNNAGVLRAGGLDELTERDFDLVTAVNYKACFICTQAVVPVMKRQYALNKACRSDVIQINSKSGLEGSKRNFAYAGSKFGAIGLTQSFALELIEYGIKVNAICPGNYFDGPLWSDPENGLFVQYLRTGKVPGAQTLEDVRRFYMSKIPMGRGCTPLDVARAIFYCREQEYETGQAVPVTGGQVMLN